MNYKLLFNSSVTATAIMLASVFSNSAMAQTPKSRTYATRQATALTGIDVLGSTSTLSNAVDNNPFTSGNMTIGIGVGATRTMYLDFNPSSSSTTSYATTIAANTPITIKFSLPAGLIGALGNVEIAAITNLRRPVATWLYTDVGTVYSGSSLAGVLSGSGTMEFTITPTAAYQGIRIAISGLASVAVGTDVYDAYVMTDTAAPVLCSDAIDALSGARAGAVSLANATGSVTNVVNASDGSLGTYATINTGAQVLSQVYLSTVFETASKLGDSVQMVIQDASSTLLNLGLLQGLKLNLYNGSGATPVQTITNDSTNLLTLNLLNPVGNIQTLTFVPNAIFDRAEIQLGGVAGAFQTLRVYEVNRKNAGVNLTASQKNIYAYAGQNFILNGTSIAPGDLVKYYDSIANGNQLASNVVPTVTGTANGVTSYFTGTTRGGCNESSERKEIIGHVVGFTNAIPDDAQLATPYLSSAAVTPASGAGLPVTPAYKYRRSASTPLPPGLAMDSTTGVISGTPTATGTYPLDMDVMDEANSLPVGSFAYDLAVNSVPLANGLLQFSAVIASGNINLNWKTAPGAAIKGYDVERSADGKSFTKIGYVSNNGESNNYQFADKNAMSGLNYYRLKVLMTNGSSEYSRVINIELKAAASISVYPNPVEGNTLFVKGENIKTITVANAVGQTIELPIVYGDAIQQIQTSSLSKGVYFLSVKKQNGEAIAYRFVVK